MAHFVKKLVTKTQIISQAFPRNQNLQISVNSISYNGPVPCQALSYTHYGNTITIPTLSKNLEFLVLEPTTLDSRNTSKTFLNRGKEFEPDLLVKNETCAVLFRLF